MTLSALVSTAWILNTLGLTPCGRSANRVTSSTLCVVSPMLSRLAACRRTTLSLQSTTMPWLLTLPKVLGSTLQCQACTAGSRVPYSFMTNTTVKQCQLRKLRHKKQHWVHLQRTGNKQVCHRHHYMRAFQLRKDHHHNTGQHSALSRGLQHLRPRHQQCQVRQHDQSRPTGRPNQPRGRHSTEGARLATTLVLSGPTPRRCPSNGRWGARGPLTEAAMMQPARGRDNL